MAHALVHILGSRSGYTTLDATPGLSTADRAELEVLGFGDATSSEAMARLETSASMVGRRLRSGRFAISRMLPGGTDDKGRPTIEVISLVLDASGYGAVVGALGRLADDVRFWRLARGAVARGYELPEQSPTASARDTGVLRAFDTWVAARKSGSVGVLSAQDAPSLLAMVALLDGQDLGDCRWGIGVVSLSAPVDICTLAPSTAAIGSRPVLRAATGDAWLSAEMAHVEFHIAQNPLLPPRASLVSAVRIEPALDADAQATPIAAARTVSDSWHPASPKRNLTLIAAMTAAASLAVLVMTTAVYVRTGRVVNVVVETAAGGAAGESQATASVPSNPEAAGAGAYPGPSVRPADRDDDGVADDADPCPAQSGFERIVLFVDKDKDGDGDALSTGKEFCLPPKATEAEDQGDRYLAKHTDQCDGVQGVFTPTDFYLDADDDGVGSDSTKQFCVELETKVRWDNNSKYVLTTGDKCPDVKGMLEPKTFWLDTDEDGLGDPNEPTKHCGETLAGRVNNSSDKDDTVRADAGKEKGKAAGPAPAKQTAVEAARGQLKSIVSECRDIATAITNLSTGMKPELYANELGAQLEELKLNEQRIFDLQKSLHPARSLGEQVGGVAAHRFVGKLWPICQERACGFDAELQADWRSIVQICSEISDTVAAAQSRYFGIIEQIYSGPENRERAIEHDKRVVRGYFDNARGKGPKSLLNQKKIREELDYFDAIGKGVTP